ncbi:adenylate/guanylate cyclase domain-containing protein [Edaphosphingomonas haloaromaticamans]|uniref:Adenylate cyclase 1 n=1 Tax=Edaphosphingomonas haloaromaticamans TaxID=653954 RepID=A0A1S1HG10_9SPHN|nr:MULTISPECIES: adenylate/guanylate cyclase domain-containing protein [Sphingomonas]MDX3884943.1 adenylate/guanylate cyclase domain-containing protein [Sphingomonas sp.]OHT20411.1 Adenylate cyclase 1 [Sphingomonas haloaromaticamans]
MAAPDQPAPAATGGIARRLRRVFRRIGPWRMAITLAFLALAIFIARYSWEKVPIAADIERMLYDIRATSTAPLAEQDDRIVMVVFNDQTLIETGRRSPLDRVTLAKALAKLDRMGARAIGIDILIDQATPEDAGLVAAFKAMRTPTRLAFVSAATNPDYVEYGQEEFLRAFQKSIAGGAVEPASVLLESDLTDNVIRSWPNQPASLPPLLANALTPVHPEFRNYTGAVRFRAPLDPERPVFAKLPIQLFTGDFPEDVLRQQIAGRYVLIGGDIFDVDQFETPATRIRGGTTIGLEIHANMLAQLLDGALYRGVPGWILWAAAILVVVMGGLTSMLDVRPWLLGLILLAQIALILLIPYWAQASGIDTQHLPVFGWIAGWFLAFAAVGTAARAVGSEQRRFAQSALGRYLPRDVASLILRDPDQLALHGEKREIYALFTDLEGFTKLSHAIAPEMVATLLNRYLDMLSDIVLRHGGTIDKFVGDAVVAFWGAPIARPDDADRAVMAAIAMYEAGEEFRRSVPEGVPPIGRTRVGLHFGEAIVGNFGGEGRIQYTALGDSMNAAARLESANKQLGTAALVSEAVVRRTSAVPFRPMGRVTVRGRSTPFAIFEPVPHLDGAVVTSLTASVARFDQGETAALAELERYAADHPEDVAVANLIYRLRKVGPGGNFVLD